MLEYMIVALLLLLVVIPASTGAWAGWTRQTGTQIAHQAVRSMQWTLLSFALLALVVLAFPAQQLPELIRLHPLNWVMLSLILLIGWVVVRFSQRYMAGELRLGYYYRWLFLTFSAVILTVLANHLLLFLLGWMTISLALHRLLVFYPNRPRTVLAAHKKFIIARLGEFSLAVSFWLLYDHTGTANINEILHQLQQHQGPLHGALVLASFGLALTALLKCAQLPVHGWLIQVVDAPTPVSALLHAGVINLGGFLLILFSPLMIQSSAANTLLLLVAGLSFVLSALIMQTRVSVKVRLAWSTNAQMGFMLVECAMGLYELALLHLVAHSLYKAHAFLSAGSTVQQHQLLRLSDSQGVTVASGAVSAMLVFGMTYIAAQWVGGSISLWLLLAVGFTSYLARTSHGVLDYVYAFSLVSLLLGVLTLWKGLASQWLGLPLNVVPSMVAEVSLLLLLTLLVAGSSLLAKQPSNLLLARVQHAFFAGLYLDEWLTRLTQRLWPMRLSSGHTSASFNKYPY